MYRTEHEANVKGFSCAATVSNVSRKANKPFPFLALVKLAGFAFVVFMAAKPFLF